MNIFIVDDHPGIRLLLSEIFIHEGYNVTTASTGKEAMERLTKEMFDIILLDNNLPIMDGMEVIERLAKQNFTKPIILMSGLTESLRDKANQYPFVKAIVSKPFDIKDMQSLVKETVNY